MKTDLVNLLVLIFPQVRCFIDESGLSRLRHYHRLEEIISHKKRNRRSADSEDYDQWESPGHLMVEIPLSGQSKMLDLYEKDNRHELPNACALYQGQVRDSEHSRVVLSRCDGQWWQGIIYEKNQTHFLHPILGTDHHVVFNEHDDTTIAKTKNLHGDSPPERQRRDVDDDLSRDYVKPEEEPLERSSRSLRKTSKSRTKTSRSPTERKLNIVIAMDFSMVQFHDKDESQWLSEEETPTLSPRLRQYLVTMMEIVNSVYNDETLENKIKVSLVGIEPLAKQDSDNLIVEDDPAASLAKVAEKLEGRSRLRRHSRHLNDFEPSVDRDLTIFLTRREFGPAGYAPIGQMCKNNPYTINRDEGFSSAFVIAHEVGHVLGMRHDGTDNVCTDDPQLGSIMAPIVQARMHQFLWSRCSNVELSKEIESYHCLNKPVKQIRSQPAAVQPRALPPTLVEKRYHQPTQPAGMFNYTLNEQCQFAFGPDHYWCSTANQNTQDYISQECSDMWCSAINNRAFCKSKHSAPLDGTPCKGAGGIKGYCFQTQCIPLGSVASQKSDGKWTEWSEWENDGRCSADCGTGTKIRRRKCVGKRNGGAECEGDSYNYQICNTQPCQNNVIDRRTFMCQRETSNPYMVPRIHKTNPSMCQLSCWDQRTHEIARTVQSQELWVDDGTPCSYDDPHGPMCIQGKCVAAGCDKETGTRGYKRVNRCGICTSAENGYDELDSCRHVNLQEKRRFKIKKGRKPTKNQAFNVTTIPAEAYDTQILLPKYANVRIEFIDTRTNFVYVLSKSFSQDVVGGALLKKQRVKGRERKTKPEYVIKGRLLYPVTIRVVPVEPRNSRGKRKSHVSIKWEFYIREEIDLMNWSKAQRGHWEPTNRWTPCRRQKRTTRECGLGEKSLLYACKLNGLEVTRKNEAVKVCGAKPRESRRKCKLSGAHCEIAYKWHIKSDWGQCSETCGIAGVERRHVVCRNSKTKQQVPDEKCLKQKPYDSRPCQLPKCPAQWAPQEWKECEPSLGQCGRGFNHREVHCTRGGRRIADGDCLEKKPPLKRDCEVNCEDECKHDQSVFCGVMYLKEYCRTDDFRKLCCQTCKKYTNVVADDSDVTIDDDLSDRSSPLPGRSQTQYHGYTPISPFFSDNEYELNADDDYDLDDDQESGTILGQDTWSRRKRSLDSPTPPQWTLEKLNELGRRWRGAS